MELLLMENLIEILTLFVFTNMIICFVFYFKNKEPIANEIMGKRLFPQDFSDLELSYLMHGKCIMDVNKFLFRLQDKGCIQMTRSKHDSDILINQLHDGNDEFEKKFLKEIFKETDVCHMQKDHKMLEQTMEIIKTTAEKEFENIYLNTRLMKLQKWIWICIGYDLLVCLTMVFCQGMFGIARFCGCLVCMICMYGLGRACKQFNKVGKKYHLDLQKMDWG